MTPASLPEPFEEELPVAPFPATSRFSSSAGAEVFAAAVAAVAPAATPAPAATAVVALPALLFAPGRALEPAWFGFVFGGAASSNSSAERHPRATKMLARPPRFLRFLPLLVVADLAGDDAAIDDPAAFSSVLLPLDPRFALAAAGVVVAAAAAGRVSVAVAAGAGVVVVVVAAAGAVVVFAAGAVASVDATAPSTGFDVSDATVLVAAFWSFAITASDVLAASGAGGDTTGASATGAASVVVAAGCWTTASDAAVVGATAASGTWVASVVLGWVPVRTDISSSVGRGLFGWVVRMPWW